MEGLAVPLLALAGVAIMLLVLNLPQVKSTKHRNDIDEEDVMRNAEMYARLYDDPDFIKDMGLADEEQRRLND